MACFFLHVSGIYGQVDVSGPYCVLDVRSIHRRHYGHWRSAGDLAPVSTCGGGGGGVDQNP